MTPTPHGQVPEALIDLIDAYAETRHRCGGIYNARTEAARKAVIEALSGVQALSAAPVVPADSLVDAFLKWCAALDLPTDTIPNSTGKAPNGGIFSDPRTRAAWGWETSAHRFVAIRRMLAASPTPPAEQAAPKAAPVTQQAGDVVAYLDVGASGYLDLGSELSEDALQQLPKGRHALVIAGTYGIDGYVAAPQPSPTTKPAPQQEAQEPVAWLVTWVGGGHNYVQAHASELPAVDQGRRMAGTVTPLYTAPQPAPAPLSDDVVKDAAFEAVRKKLCALPRYSFVLDDDGLVRRAPDRTGNWIEFDEAHALFDPVSVEAALAAQGGKNAG